MFFSVFKGGEFKMFKKKWWIKSKLIISILFFSILVWYSESKASGTHTISVEHTSIQGCLQKRDEILKIVKVDILPWEGEEIVIATVYPWFKDEDREKITYGLFTQRVGRLYILIWNGLEYIEHSRFEGIGYPLHELNVEDINGDGKKEIVTIGTGGTGMIIAVFRNMGGGYARIFYDTPKYRVQIKDIDGDKCKELLLECFAPEEERTETFRKKGYHVSVTKIYKWNVENKKYELFKVTPPHKLGEPKK